MEAPPSVLLATHWYVPLSFFSAPATRKEPSPRVKKRPASTASESPLLTLREKHFTACHAAGALVNVPPQPSWLQCCKCHLFLPLEPIQYCRIFRQLTEYCSNYDKKIRDKSSPFKQAWQSFFFSFSDEFGQRELKNKDSVQSESKATVAGISSKISRSILISWGSLITRVFSQRPCTIPFLITQPLRLFRALIKSF